MLIVMAITTNNRSERHDYIDAGADFVGETSSQLVLSHLASTAGAARTGRCTRAMARQGGTEEEEERLYGALETVIVMKSGSKRYLVT